MSELVTEPYSASVSPTFRAISTSTLPIRSAMRLRDLLLFGLLRIELDLLALDLFLVAFGRQQRQLARQQVVARVAVGDFHDLAAASEVVDMFSQYDFHDAS